MLPTTQKQGSKSQPNTGVNLILTLLTFFFQFLTLLVITDNFKVKSMRTAVLDTGKLETGNIKNKFPTE